MKKIHAKKILASSVVSLLLVQMFYTIVVEPSIVAAATAPDTVQVSLTVDSGITITAPTDITMTPNMGISASGSIGTVVWNVKTNHATGYSLAVKGPASLPALQSGANSFADYTETVAGTPELWSVASGAKEFGYSSFGTDTIAAFGTGANCGTAGAPNATLKYVGFLTTDKIVSTRNVVTTPTGIDTTVCFAAQQNNIYAASGTYTTNITATATEI